jgi:hypothetical protein
MANTELARARPTWVRTLVELAGGFGDDEIEVVIEPADQRELGE